MIQRHTMTVAACLPEIGDCEVELTGGWHGLESTTVIDQDGHTVRELTAREIPDALAVEWEETFRADLHAAAESYADACREERW